MQKVLTVVISIAVILALFLIVYFLFLRNVVRSIREQIRIGVENNQGSVGLISPTPTPGDGNWENYKSPIFDYSVSVPSEAYLERPGDGSEAFVINGPTQQSYTQFKDGMYVSFLSNNHGLGNNLKSFLCHETNSLKNDPIVSEVSELMQINMANLSGYSFDVVTKNGYTSTYIYLDQKEDRYFRIVKQVSDPGNIGFEDRAEKVLSSLIVDLDMAYVSD